MPAGPATVANVVEQQQQEQEQQQQQQQQCGNNKLVEAVHRSRAATPHVA